MVRLTPLSIVVTGCNRGLGLELVKQILEKIKPEVLVATFRDLEKSAKLFELASNNPNLHPIQLDVRDVGKYTEFVSQVDDLTKGNGLNLLFNNAGVLMGKRDGTVCDTDLNDLQTTFAVNTIAPVLLTQAFLPLLEKANSISEALGIPHGLNRAAVVNMSSTLGSIQLIGDIEGPDGENTLSGAPSGGFFSYRLSKTALNSATRAMSFDLCSKGIIVVAIHPGWSQTDMGSMEAPLRPKDGIAGVVRLLESMDKSYSGKYFRHTGEEIPW